MATEKSFYKNKFLLINIVGILTGILGGYLYYHFYGCSNGCPINSNPYLSMIWGGLIGYLLAGFVTDFLKKKKDSTAINESE